MGRDEPIGNHMTALPHTIGADQGLLDAEKRMNELGIRHLPVLEGGKLVGIVSERDLKVVRGIPNINFRSLKVSDVLVDEPYAVTPETPLGKVARTMAQERLGSAIITQGGKVVGIFTTVDALEALGHLMSG